MEGEILKYILKLLTKYKPFAERRVSSEKYGRFLTNLQQFLNLNPVVVSGVNASRSELAVIFQALDFYAEKGEYITVAETARLTDSSMPAVSRTLRSLSQKGYIKRILDENDRRSVRIAATEKGKKTLDDFIKSVVSIIDTAMEEFTDEELSSMIEYHGRFVNALTKATKGEQDAGDKKHNKGL